MRPPPRTPSRVLRDAWSVTPAAPPAGGRQASSQRRQASAQTRQLLVHAGVPLALVPADAAGRRAGLELGAEQAPQSDSV
ncbi:MAG: hypothetical protein KatS3mg060_2303 [Dehalococcoidia bacterium]|nr:MAG: hypothetical protein KatS3mg060_2303 [Dehalococcoidia bacterium]